MAAPLDIYYWDSCIFYEHLRDEPVSGSKKIAIGELLIDNEQKRNRICTSVFTHLEVLPKKIPLDREAEYLGLFSSQFFYDIEVDRNILSLAREIRDYYYRDAIGDVKAKVMSTGDSIHLATAIIHDVTEFHTRDGKTKGGNVPLIGLPEASPNGLVCGKYKLKIVSPEAEQGDLLEQ